MGKVARRKEAAKGGSQRPPWSWWGVGAALVLASTALWNGLRQPEGSGEPDDVDDGDEEGEEEDSSIHDRLAAVRQALFDPDDGVNGVASKRKGRFSSADYWEERYTKTNQEHYDWYGTWNSESAIRLKPYVQPYLPAKVGPVLNLGCGNSRLSKELSDDGFTDVMNIDISQTVIDKMAKRFSGHKALKFMQMDITNMTFDADHFDFIIEKGTLDALYTGATDLVAKAVPQIFRVLRPGGAFVSVSFGPPASRRLLNETMGDGNQAGWDKFSAVAVEKSNTDGNIGQTFHIYIMSKPVAP